MALSMALHHASRPTVTCVPCKHGTKNIAPTSALLSTPHRGAGVFSLRKPTGSHRRRTWLSASAQGSSNTRGKDAASDSTDGDEEEGSMVIMSGVSYRKASPQGGDSPSDQSALPDSTPQYQPKLPDPKDVNELKVRLLAYVSGLDRGISAFPRQQREVDTLAAALERSLDKAVSLSYDAIGSGMDKFRGRWRLVYSSGFGSGSLGGRQPGPPSAFVPFTLGQVYQDVDPSTTQLDNVVELCFRVPSLPFSTDDQDPVTAELTLGHSFQVSDGRKVTITFETTEVNVKTPWPQLGNIPSLAVPQLPENLRPPTDLRSAAFDVTFLDDDMRITRGDRGELRVYVRA